MEDNGFNSKARDKLKPIRNQSNQSNQSNQTISNEMVE